MERREMLKLIALYTGAAMIGGEFLLAGCKAPTGEDITFSDKVKSLLNEVGETILPRTDTPGAKDADVAKVMEVVVRDCYWPEHQKVFVEGIRQIDEEAKGRFGKTFMEISPEQRKELLIALEEEAKKFNEKVEEKDKPVREKMDKESKGYDFIASPRHYYTMMKQLTMLAYFSSKECLTEAFEYIPVPGRYDGAYKIKPGDKLFSG
ncbi:MAG: gluconate 2-dehydrogenase subunit 3 family protein [Saprospiraceae bacterium]|mgnify:CR=1 FL=1|nr:gluconate 2-dehydrogenase subunit 3 family protein [Saprospiraceae bacterium]MBX7179331.1 gluconate 2-dehydrogenase subunit 3 family protein [Saprospiraceae bacterium]MCB0591846.1 gluconate 2-dehydrogenase subunit 3 family protein [Saprospiraceae bacterium]MCC7148455.1 gluconate 2-dehydrogenase subunit 3 family protein [Saprospiraceae bacterium]MCO5284725.1 gluconate 2-dehydrogenase subunit 3 family protein [Saprospiraceae bacterium]